MEYGSEIEHSEAFLHSGRVCIRVTRVGTRCDFAARKEYLRVCFLWVEGNSEIIEEERWKSPEVAEIIKTALAERCR